MSLQRITASLRKS